MPFNVDVFRSSLALRGALRTNKFECTFVLPPCFQGDPDLARYNALCRDSGLFCDGASIPGLFLQTLKFRRYGFGTLDTAPIVPVFNDVQLRFIVDASGDNWKMFHKWVNKVSNSDTSQGIFGVTEQDSGNQMYPYELGYQVDYVTGMIVSVYNDVGDRVKDIYLNQAFPSAISDVKLDWGDGGDVARFIVNFSIQDWQSSDVGVSTPLTGPSPVQVP